MNMNVVTYEEFHETVKSGVVLVDFFANWCGPCKMLAPVLEELAEEYAGKAVIVKVDVDKEQRLAADFGVMSIPTLVLFKNGEAVKQVVGFQPKPQLAAMLDAAL